MFCYARNNEADGTQEGAGLTKRFVTEYGKNYSQIMPDQIPEGLAFCVFKMPYYNIIYILILWIMNIYNHSYSLSLPRFQRLS
nr:MAG TPA: hypothetical protein [Caudoviricetes sp.]